MHGDNVAAPGCRDRQLDKIIGMLITASISSDARDIAEASELILIMLGPATQPLFADRAARAPSGFFELVTASERRDVHYRSASRLVDESSSAKIRRAYSAPATQP